MAAVDLGSDFSLPDRKDLVGEKRWRLILDLMQLAVDITEWSPDSERIQAYRKRREMDWQQIHQRLFANASRT